MTTKKLAIIGAGPGGYECAVRAAHAGLEVHIFDRIDHLGGTCLCEGCIPTKCFCHSAKIFHQIQEAKIYGIQTDLSNFSFAEVLARKSKIVQQMQLGVQTLLKTPGISFHDAFVRFALHDAHTLIYGDKSLTADFVFIATGALPKYLSIPGAHMPGILTSTEILQLPEIPTRLCIIGGGVIGLEFASIFNLFGSKVTVIEYCKEILPNFDKEVAKRLRTLLKRAGINFVLGAPVTAIHTCEETGELHISYEHRNAIHDLAVDKILMAIGRQPNLESLNLTEADIAFTRKGVTVDENMQTNQLGVYAVGDINGLCQLAHAATFQSFKALSHLLEKPSFFEREVIPSAIYTYPEAATVGYSEEKALLTEPDAVVHKAYYRANGRALTMGAESDGLIKIITDHHGHILGGHILGDQASELIHEISLVMSMKGTLSDLSHSIHAHPTLSELFSKLN